jgi:putative tricarboxylic transport membrane protein
MSHVLWHALGLVLAPYNLLVMLCAGAFGLFVGAMPGLTATMATALLVPVTFFMEPEPAIAAIVTATAMAIFAGDLPGALVRIPGTPASAAYVEDAYRLTRKGHAEQVLGAGLVFSTIGGLFGSAVLCVFAPALAEFALDFSSFEYFWLALFGLSCAVFISTGRPIKGIVSVLLSLLVATIGIDPTAGHPRFTFGSVELMGGVGFIPAMIGLFAISEVLRWVTSSRQVEAVAVTRIGNIFRGQLGLVRRYYGGMLRSAVVGTGIGILPGAGADIAAWITYALSKRFSKEPEKFGTGHIEGITAASTANNASLGGAWVPAMVFGIPGDSITAIVVGVLYLKGMNPGPTIMLRNPQLLYAVFITFFVANLMLVPLGWAAINLFRNILAVPREILMPLILLLCLVGSFAINNTVFDVGVMLLFGVIGYVMEENAFPVAPTILGIVLGPMIEQNFMTSMMKANGSPAAFFERPIAGVLGGVTLIVWCRVVYAILRRGRSESETAVP